MAHPLSKVAFQGTWAAVKERTLSDGSSAFDVWQWNVWKLKWVRLSGTACGYGSLLDATVIAQDLDRDTKAMLEAARVAPPPLDSGLTL